MNNHPTYHHLCQAYSGRLPWAPSHSSTTTWSSSRATSVGGGWMPASQLSRSLSALVFVDSSTCHISLKGRQRQKDDTTPSQDGKGLSTVSVSKIYYKLPKSTLKTGAKGCHDVLKLTIARRDKQKMFSPRVHVLAPTAVYRAWLEASPQIW